MNIATIMPWVLDLLLVIFFVATIISYTRKGFVKSIMESGRGTLSLLLAWSFGPKLGAIISEKFLGDKIANRIYNSLASFFDSTAETFDLSQLFAQAPENFVKTVNRFGTDLTALEAQYGNMTAASKDNLLDLSQSIADPVNTLVGNLCGYIIVFIVAYLLLILLTGIISKIFELPVLKQINRFLGFILGLVFGVINVLMICYFGTYLLQLLTTFNDTWDTAAWVEGTKLFKIIAQFKIF